MPAGLIAYDNVASIAIPGTVTAAVLR